MIGFGLCLISTAVVAREVLDRPNILVFLVDDLGYGDLGFTGHPTASSPNLDRLAAGGLRLTSWYTAYPVCTSSRTAVMTGRLPPRVGMPGVINSLSASGLPLTEVTVADTLKARGYATMAVGKWHLGQTPPYLPIRRGFDAFLGLPYSVDDGVGFTSSCGGGGASIVGNTLGPSLPLPLIRQQGNLSEIVEQPTDLTLLTSRLYNFTATFAAAHAHEPMFLYVAFGHVHTATPNIDPPIMQYAGCDYVNTTRRGRFGDALAEVDGFVGAIHDHMTALGIANNTLTLFFSDNGPSLRWGVGAGSLGLFIGEAATFSSRGVGCAQWPGGCYNDTGKGSTWEGGIRMPAFANWPGTIAAGRTSSEVISSMDILPSMASLAGASLPAGIVLDGKSSLGSIILDPSSKSAHEVLWFYNEPAIANVSTKIFAARYGRYKVHFITSPGLGGGVFPNIGRPAPTVEHNPPIIFDVEADPSESNPLGSHNNGELIATITSMKAQFEKTISLKAIDPRFGYEWALCCGVGCPSAAACVCHCAQSVPLPPL